MITVLYFLLLLAAAVEDYKSRTVRGYKIFLLWLLGGINLIVQKENRWVMVTLTCICFILLLGGYAIVRWASEKRNLPLELGGADVRLIPAMMLVQGWDAALTGVFLGLCMAVLYHLTAGKQKKEIPLVPWMGIGCFLVEIFYLFSGRSVI